jgi:hypothetical protein
LIAALNSLYEQDGWAMDSGATSHMTNDEGPEDSSRDPSLQ